MQERDSNVVVAGEFEFPLKDPKEGEEDSELSEFSDCHENQKSLQEEYQEIQKKVDRSLQAFGLENIEDLKAEVMTIRKEEKEGMSSVSKKSYLEGLEDLLAAFQEAEMINLQITSQNEYNLAKEEFESGLKEFELTNMDDVREELEDTLKDEQRLANNPNRRLSLEKAQAKIKKLKDLIELWEEVEKLRLREEKWKDEKKKQQQLAFFKKGLKEFDLTSIQDVKDELEDARRRAERLAKNPGRQPALQEVQARIKKLEDLLEAAKEVEKSLAEEELQQHQNKIQEKEMDFQKHLKDSQLDNIEDVKEDLETARQKAERLVKNPDRQKAFETEQRRIKMLEGLMKEWEEVEELKTKLGERQSQAKKEEQVDPPKYLEDPDLPPNVIEPIAREEIPPLNEPNFEEITETIPNIDSQTILNEERQKVKDELENLKEDISKMPYCFERLLILMNILVSRVFYSEYSESESSDFVREEIPKVLNELKERTKTEILDTKKMKYDLDEISILINKGDWKSAKSSLRLRLKEVQPLNIAEVERLIKKGSEAATLIRGKDAIIFIGETGVGKSTTLHYLSGSRIIRRELEKGYHYIPIEIKNPVLAGVTTSASSASETRYIKCIPIKLTDLGIPKSGCVYFLDLPGYDDSNGAEVDISNAVNILRTISECRSVKPLVLVSKKSLGEKMKGIKKLGRILAGMLPGLQQSMEKSPFSYLFTKFSPNEVKFIEGSIKDVLAQLTPEEEADKGFCNVIEDVLCKIQGGVQVVDPLASEEAKGILSRIIDSNFISQPDQVFKFSVAEDSKAKLQNQCFLTQKTIQSATERMDFELVIYKLSELKRFSELVSLEFVEKSYLDSVQFVAKFLEGYSQTSIEKFSRCFKDGNTLEEKDIKEFIHKMKNAQAADQLRKEHLSKEVTPSSAFMQTVLNQSNQLLTKIKESSIIDLSLKINLEKLELLSHHFSNDLGKEYESSIISLVAKSREAVESFKSLHLKDEFEQSVRLLQNIYGFMECMEVYLGEDVVKESKNMIEEFLSGDIKGTGSGLEAVFKKNRINPEDEESLEKGFTRLRSIKEKYNNQLDIITSVYQEMTRRSLKYIKETKEKIAKFYEEEKYDSLFDVERLFKEIVLLRKIPEIGAETHHLYYETVDSLRAISQQVKIDIVEEIKRCQNTQVHDDFDYGKLQKYLLVLESMSWMDEFNHENFVKIKRTIDEEVMKHSEIHKKQLKKFNLDLDNYDQLEKAKQIASKLNEILGLEKFLPILADNRKIVEEDFEKKVEVTLNVIQSYLDKWNDSSLNKKLERKEIEKSLLYLQKCKELSLSRERTANLISTLKALLESSYQRDSEQFETCHQAIMSYGVTQNNERLGNSIRTSVVFAQTQEDKNSNSEVSDNISSVSERLEMNQLTNKECLMKNAQTLLKILRRATQLKRDVPHLYQIYDVEDSLIDHWKGELKLDVKDLSGKMLMLSDSANTSVRKYQELQSKLHIARALGVLDEFLDGDSFRRIYEEYQTKHSKQTAQAHEKYIQSIKSGDFTPILNNTRCLRSRKLEEEVCSDQLEELKQYLSDALEDLMSETVSQTQQAFFEKGLPNPDRMKSIVARMKQLGKAYECCETEDLNFSVEKLKVCIEKVERVISDELAIIFKEYRNLIRLESYVEAEFQRQRFWQFCRMLGQRWEDDLSKSRDEFDRIRQEEVEKIIKPYKTMPIEEYAYHSPRKVYESLELRREDASYEAMLRLFKETIERTCWEEVKRIESLDLTQKSESLKGVRSILHCLPQCVEAEISKKLNRLEGDVDQVKKRYSSELQSVKKNNDAKKTADLFKSLKEMKMKKDLEDLQEHISKDIQQLKSDILSSLHLKDVEKSLKLFAELNERNTTLDDVQGVNQVYLEVRTTCLQIVQNWYTSLLKGLNSTTNEHINGEAEQSFICLMKFVKFKRTSQNNIFEDLFPETQIKHMNGLIVDFIKNYKKSCSDAFDSFDFSRIYKFLNFAQISGALVGYFKAYAIDNAGYDACLSSVNTMMEEVELYKSLNEKFCQMILELSEELNKVEFINEKTKKFIKHITEFFVELNSKQCNLEKVQKFENLDLDAKLLFNQSCERINAQKDQIYQKLEILVERVFEDGAQKEDYDKFNLLYNNLVAATKNLKFLKNGDFGPEDIEQKFKRKIGLYAQEIQSEPESTNFLKTMAEGLQKLKGLSTNVSVFKSEIEGKINEMLTSLKTMKGSMSLPKLAKLLSSDQKGYGASLVADCQIFQNVKNLLFNSRTQKHGIEYVLQYLRGSGINKALLRRRYDDFLRIYKELVDKYLQLNIDLDELVYRTKLLVGSVRQTLEEIKWSSDMVAKIPELLAHIFAIWTLQNTGSYFETDDSMNRDSYLLMPHAAQVISIFRLLGVGEDGFKLQNNLAQIGTGEGKSITLAVTSIVFALFGFNVFSGCYNSYLCERDYRAFSSLFSLLGVSEQIRYGTFNKICEDVINQDGDIRKLVENLFLEGAANLSAAAMVKSKSNCPSILLIDEVDVFFSKEFYGRLYTPSASIRDPTITKLIDLIWQNRKTKWTFLQVKETQEYKDCCARFHDLEGLIEEAVKDMLFDLKEFESHDYIVKADKIGYKQCENISFKVTCRYQTLFAYYLEHERQNISPQSLEENKRFIIKCGSFSYAEIIKQFKYIIGVTGTLEHLSDMEKHVIKEEYKIEKQTFLPSVFGENQLKFSEKTDIMIANESDYYNTLKREIIDRLNSGKSSNAKRAVLVFFESEKKLMEFLNSSQMADLKDEVEYLTEEATAEEKENIVKRATSAGRITFLTRRFGRGTDFVVHDQEVATNGGIHVIQAFLSEERSEEVQIKGRGARQGDLGSYSMVLLDLSLEKFLILPEDLEKLRKEGKVWNRLVRLVTLDSVEYKNEYELMNARRNELFAQTYKNNEKCVIEAKEMHIEAMKFLEDISLRDLNAIQLFLIQENKGVSEVKKSRTILATDGTISMDSLHQNTKTTIKKTCSNIAPILKDYGIPEDCFQLQFVVYRNYNSKEDKLLEFSSWETKPNALTPFLESIAVEGGWGNEAIEVALSYANQQHEKEPISQIILIGDAPANSKRDVEVKRDRFGESYWSTTKFAAKTTYKEEVAKLKQNGIPVHSFYMKESTKENFTEISNATGGKCAPLDIYSDAGATALTNLVTEVLLKQIGEQNGRGDELVEAFRNKVLQSFCE